MEPSNEREENDAFGALQHTRNGCGPEKREGGAGIGRRKGGQVVIRFLQTKKQSIGGKTTGEVQISRDSSGRWVPWGLGLRDIRDIRDGIWGLRLLGAGVLGTGAPGNWGSGDWDWGLGLLGTGALGTRTGDWGSWGLGLRDVRDDIAPSMGLEVFDTATANKDKKERSPSSYPKTVR
jgi:hypothetical protein